MVATVEAAAAAAAENTAIPAPRHQNDNIIRQGIHHNQLDDDKVRLELGDEEEDDDNVSVDNNNNNCQQSRGNNNDDEHDNAAPHNDNNPTDAIVTEITIDEAAINYNNNYHHNNKTNSCSNNNNNILRTTFIIDQSKYTRPGRPKHAAQTELYYGIILYLTAIFLPSIPRYIYQLYIFTTSSSYCRVLHERILWCVWVLWRMGMFVLWKVQAWMVGSWMLLWSSSGSRISSSLSSLLSPPQSAPSSYPSTTFGRRSSNGSNISRRMMRRLGKKIRKYIFSTSTAALWEEFNRQQQQSQTTSASSTRSYNNIHQHFLFVPPSIRVMVLQDMQLLVLLSIVLAIVRVWFVHILVPEYLVEVKQLEALTRCKSSHLLSSSSHNLLSLGGGGGRNCSSGDGTSTMDQSPRWGGRNGQDVGGGGGGDGRWCNRIRVWALSHLYRLQPSINRALGHEPSAARYDAMVEQQEQQQQSPTLLRRSISNSTPTQQLFFAPRHATAAFRLFFTSVSCLSALFLFQNAEFWPRAVFGTHPNASTRHCWDLSGTFSALGLLDDDYDAKNGALKYFFLAQAAYQLHSLCFHTVSMLLLLFYGGSGGDSVISKSLLAKVFGERFRGRRNNVRSNHEHQHNNACEPQQKFRSRRLVSMKTSMQSYFRPMIEHVIVLAILIGAYLFSGMRRLCVVGIFTMEMSGVFLQLLQVCIYAPEKSWLRKPRVALFVHRILTVPTFVYCRLIVLPFILWRSALFESHEWLKQIEKVFSPVWSERLYVLFNGSLCLIFALNLILFRRLLFILKR